MNLEFVQLVSICIFLSLLPHAYCMYEEDIGTKDWQIRSIGPLKFSFFDQAHMSRRVIIASELSILASVTLRSGEMAWRRFLEEYRPIDTMLHRGSTLITVSDNGKVMRKWDPNSGHLDWEVSTEGGYETQDSYVQAFLNEKNNIVLLTSSKLKQYTVGGHLLFEIDLSKEIEDCEISRISSLKGSAIILCHSEDLMKLGWMRLQELQVQEKGIVMLTRVKFRREDCIIIGMSRIVCLDRINAKFHVLVVQEGAEFESYRYEDLQISPEDLTEESCIISSEHFSKSGARFFFKISANSHYILEVDLTTKSLKRIQHFSSPQPLLLFDEALENNIIIFSLTSNDSHIQIQCYDLNARVYQDSLELSLALERFSGYPVRAVPFLFYKKGQTLSYRLIVSFQDGSISLIQQTGRISWTRDEAISEIVSAKLVSLNSAPESAGYSSALLDSAVSSNPVQGFLKMIYSQVLFLRNAAFLFRRALFDTSSMNITIVSSSPQLVPSVLVLVTRLGNVYSIDSRSGTIIWRHYIPHLTSYMSSLYEDRYIIKLIRSSPPLLAVLGASKHASSCNGTVSIIFDPITGDIAESPSCLPYNITQVVQLEEDQDKVSALVLLDSDNNIHIFPQDSILHHEADAFMYTADSQKGRICGHLFSIHTGNTLHHVPTWTFMVPVDREELVHFSVRDPKERTYANARVLSDRSVLYKYLNPNLLAFVTESKNDKKPCVNVYVMDGVSGRLIHQSHHANARSTVPPTLSENWLVYQIINLKEKRQELVILEMYEGKLLYNASSWTSFDSVNVRFLSQSYILPGDLYSMTVTNTHRGITPKDIILGFSNGQLFSLPKSLVEPRIPPELSSVPAQAPLKPPSPSIPVFYQRVINYNRSIDRLREIIVVPAELESTCSVVAYGVDVFLTLSSPSKSFDTLAGDFGYVFIVAVMGLFLLASIIGSKVSIYRSTTRSWS